MGGGGGGGEGGRQPSLTAGDLLSDTSSENPDLSGIVLVSCVIFAVQLDIAREQSLVYLQCFVQLDLPLSADDMNWIDLLYILANCGQASNTVETSLVIICACAVVKQMVSKSKLQFLL